ncbi:MAG: 1-hydroxycarotenoid 3,4-desaturase CrtD [Pseudomonadota bacterium]
MIKDRNKVVVIGAGLAGLASAARLAHAGFGVTVLEAHGHLGGKMRTLPSPAGPVDTGPTVMTMKPVFDALFADLGQRLEDHVTLIPEQILARHYWRDGSCFDLMADPEATAENILAWGGPRAQSDYLAYAKKAKTLFEAFDAPMMQAASPSVTELALAALRSPQTLTSLLPLATMSRSLVASFKDARLRQLFGRYATYVGGSPYQSPALLSLISHSEAKGVWRIKGGMSQLAQALGTLAETQGTDIRLNTGVARIETQSGSITGVVTQEGQRIPAAWVIHAGDPKALHDGLLGQTAQPQVPTKAISPRALSACVYAFAAKPHGPELAHHTVFFGEDPKTEFGPLARGEMPQDPTLYICAQDRGEGQSGMDSPSGLERFEIIMNAPPTPNLHVSPQETAQCQTTVFETLAKSNMTFRPEPIPQESLTMPAGFAAMFPGSNGSLYGKSPHGMTSALTRPRARTKLPGLYLTGGGTHPGAGIPMVVLSAKHVAEAILTDRTSRWRSTPTAMPGGTSTASAPMANAPSPSSPS